MLIKVILICFILKCATAQGSTKEYKLEYSFKANWYDANLFCLKHGMRLATINSDQEQQRVRELIQANGPADSVLNLTYENFWISGSDLARTGRLMWFSTGKFATFSLWNYGMPGDEGKHCVRLSYDRPMWTFDFCDTLYYFICEPSV